jgi:hypothetical protein
MVAAYRRAKSLDFAGCVISKDAIRWLVPGLEALNLENEFMFSEYSVPLNDGRFDQAEVLNVNWHYQENRLPDVDIRQFTHEPFWAHGKEVNSGVLVKIDNTERYLRFLRVLRSHKTAPFRKKA